MIYCCEVFKVVHFNGVENLKEPPYLGQIELGGQIFESKKGLLPIQLSWRYRIYEKGQHISSFIAEGKYLLKFTFDEDPIKDLLTLTKESHENLLTEWYKVCAGDPIPDSSESAQLKQLDLIVAAGRHFHLLKS